MHAGAYSAPHVPVQLRPVEIDELSSVRYVHASAFRRLAASCYTPDEIEAFVKQIYSRAYADQVLSGEALGAWIGSELAGTASWSPSSDTGHTARVSDVYVQPLFTGIGIGTTLVRAVEQRALRAGFTEMSVRVTVNAVPFFTSLGYMVTSHGVRSISHGIGLRVSFMRRMAARPTIQ